MILMIYKSDVYKEFILPNTDNEDYTILLDKDLFQLQNDITLRMDITAKSWKLYEENDYFMSIEGKRVSAIAIREGDIIEFETWDNERFQGIVMDAELAFHIHKKYDITQQRSISIGREEDSVISYQFMDLISKNHGALVREQDGFYIEDYSANGIFINSRRIQRRMKLQFGDVINIFGLMIVYLNDVIAVGTNYGKLKIDETILEQYQKEPLQTKNAQANRRKQKINYFNRSPRNILEVIEETVEIEEPPTPQRKKKKPTLYVVGPSFTMAIPMMLGCLLVIYSMRAQGRTAGAYMYTGIVTAVGAAILGGIWAVFNLKYEQKSEMEEEQERFNAYGNYLIDVVDDLKKKYAYNRNVMTKMYPSAKECCQYDGNNSKLWNRNGNHSDFLFSRLGIGNVPFQVQIEIPKKKFSVIYDNLKEKPEMIKKEFQNLEKVPVGIDFLETPLVGIIGGEEKRGARAIAYELISQIAANNCYTDVKMVFLYNEKEKQDWEFVRWFPHVWNADKTTRYIATNKSDAGDLFYELINVFRRREEQTETGKEQTAGKPHYMIFIEDESLLEEEPFAKYIYSADRKYGMTAIILTDKRENLPNVCETIIQNDTYFKGMSYVVDKKVVQKEIKFDQVSAHDVKRLAISLADVRVKELETNMDIPNELTFMQMYGVSKLKELHVLDRWRKNRTFSSMKVPIGKKAGGSNCYLDVHEKYHGPHGLIAGTTGSGKSETLQTYMLSLALNYSPDDVVFFVIDFKGGGMANLFSGLPHMVGTISNLSGNQVRRAMISIKSENNRRQRLFSEYGVNNINLYTRLYKNKEATTPIPHLLIIIDEFAELKREEPEFMRELISVAQVGRSLGVHLILATQKPSGTVDDNIWSNSKFRLCLRVQDRQDSNDMLHKPDAAYITQAGRCYLQVGNDEIYELFQSAYSGAIYDEEAAEHNENETTMITNTGKAAIVGRKKKENKAGEEQTQLEAIVNYLDQVAKENSYEQCMQLWLPVLPEKICLEELEGFCPYNPMRWENEEEKWTLDAVVGFYDDPQNQSQQSFTIDFATKGNYAVCGSIVSGKSTFLQTAIYSLVNKYSPKQLNLYLLDFSSQMLSSFEGLAHVGGFMNENSGDKMDKFFHMMEHMMQERKKLFHGGNYSQYVRANGVRVPAVIIVIDSIATFREKTEGKYDAIVQRISREGAGYGIFFLISAAGFGMSEIPSRLADNIKNIVTLELGDRFRYMEILRTSGLQIMPESGVKGRGLAWVDGKVLEYQTAVAMDAQDDYDRANKITQLCKKITKEWNGETAIAVPEIPSNPILSEFVALKAYKECIESNDKLPFAYQFSDASIYSVDLSTTYCYVISGKERTGRKNVLRVMLESAMEKQGQICVIEKTSNEFEANAQRANADYITNDKELFNYFQKITGTFKERNGYKQQLLSEGKSEKEIYEAMQKYEPIYIFVTDIAEFFEGIYQPEAGVGAMSGFVENIIEKGMLHNIFFIGCMNTDYHAKLSMYKAYTYFVGYKSGVHMGGNLSAQRIFNFSNIPFKEMSKVYKKGIGMVPSTEDETVAEKIIVPLAGK